MRRLAVMAALLLAGPAMAQTGSTAEETKEAGQAAARDTKEKAKQAKEWTKEQNEKAEQRAETKEKKAEQRAENMEQSAEQRAQAAEQKTEQKADQMGTASSSTQADASERTEQARDRMMKDSFDIEGKISKASGKQLTLQREGAPAATLHVDKTTKIELDGQQASMTQLKPGQDVKASFNLKGDKPTAVEIKAEQQK